jgi:ABC-type dipeptide/oligopeptide/nickel transport system permease component
MLTAKAKGLPPIDQLEHAFRIAILPVLSVLALQAGFLLGGTVIMEYLFVRRGLGSLLHSAVLDRDYAVVQALVVLSAIVYVIANGFASVGRQLLDPRT